MMKILVPEARAQSRKPANVLSTHRHPFHQRCVRFYAPKPPALAAPFYHAPKTHSFKTRFCRRAQEQLHLSLTGAANEVALDFVVHPANATQVAVTLNGAPVDADCTTATINAYTAQFCVALFSGLAPNTQYTYAVTSSAAARPVTYSFTNAPSARPPIFAVYADFGFGNDVSLSALVKDAAQNGFDYVIHAGDWAYDLDSSSSTVGNSFMNSVQPYAAVKPYMCVPCPPPPSRARGARLMNHSIQCLKATAPDRSARLHRLC
jgi:hypothetical protein